LIAAPPRPKLRATIATWLMAALALFALVGRFIGAGVVVHAAEWWIADLALASVVAIPAVVGFMARRRPHLYQTAGFVCIALFAAGMVLVYTLPLIVPALMFLTSSRGDGPERSVVPAFLLAAVAIASIGYLIFAPGQTVCWTETGYADGRVVVARDHASEELSGGGSFGQRMSAPKPGEVSSESGCTDGAIAPSTSLLILAAVSTGLVATRRFS
jgi:hypothetical protein